MLGALFPLACVIYDICPVLISLGNKLYYYEACACSQLVGSLVPSASCDIHVPCAHIPGLLGALFPLPRVIYAMSTDGLVFRSLGNVHPRFQTPVVGTILAGLLTGIMASLFDLKHLVDMMSIGTLMAYSIVAACVMLLRYEEDEDSEIMIPVSDSELSRSELQHGSILTKLKGAIDSFFNLYRYRQSNKSTASLVSMEVLVYCE
uniref:Uncharacterized protein n=1 Tax=Timema douglasi TaxID=61478 RepID=A0A7R8VYW6_TIMDO|nr:unnamed protein product [Timema douglasi]